MDVAVNLWYCVLITTVVIKDLQRDNRDLRRAKATASQPSHGPGGAHSAERMEHPVANTRVAYLCGNLFFSEMAEVLGPLAMGTASLIMYYLLPNDNYKHITYMDPRVGVTEALFLQGMAFVLVDAVLEAATLAGLVLYIRKVIGVDPMRVGWFIVQRHRAYYFFISLSILLLLVGIFLRHNGHDTTFEFAWLAPGFVYDPSNTTTAMLWS